MSMPEPSPISFPVHVGRLPKKGMPVEIEADANQRAALAEIHGLNGIEALKATLLVEAWRSSGVRVTGRIEARLEQICVASGDPIPTEIDAEFEALYVPAGSKLTKPKLEGGEMVIDPDGPDLPETFEGDTIDAGQVVEEFFALELDPYTRKDGAAFVAKAEAPEPDGPLQQKLRALKDRL
jgi:uncharacterized metal-binding protein YceD (DUF177 family)